MLRRAILATGAMLLAWPVIASAATTIAGIYTDSIFTQCGANVESCTALFKAIPANKILIVNRVACQIGYATTAKVSGLELYRATDENKFDSQYLAPMSFISTQGTKNYYLLNAETLLAIKPGDRPAVKISFWDATATPRLACSVHGTIQAAP